MLLMLPMLMLRFFAATCHIFRHAYCYAADVAAISPPPRHYDEFQL